MLILTDHIYLYLDQDVGLYLQLEMTYPSKLLSVPLASKVFFKLEVYPLFFFGLTQKICILEIKGNKIFWETMNWGGVMEFLCGNSLCPL